MDYDGLLKTLWRNFIESIKYQVLLSDSNWKLLFNDNEEFLQNLFDFFPS